MWYVEIVESGGGEVVKAIECKSEQHADRIEDGIGINLNWDEYETRIVFKDVE